MRSLGLIGMERKVANWKVTWCRVMHDDIAYAGGEEYWCRRCHSRFLVPWLSVDSREAETSTAIRTANLGREIPIVTPIAA